MSKIPLKAVFLDVDDTAYSTTEFAELARKNAVQAMIRAGLRIDEQECLRELNEVISEFSSNYAHHFDKLLVRLPEETRAHAHPDVLVAAGIVAYHRTKFQFLSPYEDVIEVLKILRERSVLLGIITAGVSVKQAEKIYRLGLHELVDARHIHITDSIGIAKTNPKIFLRACRIAAVEPSEVIYIGDNPIVDVDVPQSIGMRTILSRRSGKYMNVTGKSEPNHIVHNFWDVLDIIDQNYDIIPVEA